MVEEITGVKSPFEMKEAFESYIADGPKEYDENKMFYAVLSRAFESFDIIVPEKEFILPNPASIRVPGWMR